MGAGHRVRADGGFLSAGFTRSKFPAWGSEGGQDGSSNYVKVIRADGTEEDFAFVSELKTARDDVIRVITGAGGGLGDPKARDTDAVRADVKAGRISAERARAVYRVEV